MSALRSRISLDDRSIDALASKMEKQLENAVRDIKVELHVDGRTLARASASGAKKNGRRT